MRVYKIWNKKIFYSLFKRKSQKTRAETVALENKLKELEENPDCIFDRNYLEYKKNAIHEEKTNGVKIRSKCELYEFGGKFSGFFLNLEKQHALLDQVRTLLWSEKEVTVKDKINQELECFNKNLFSEKFPFLRKSSLKLVKVL